MEEDTINVQESMLCRKCSVLRINDRELGGFTAQNALGKDYLEFHGDDSYEKTLSLDYAHHDDFPEMPHLRASAEAGCAFCAALRSAALESGFCGIGRAIFGLRYLWYDRANNESAGLRMLLADFRVENDENQPVYKKPLAFYVDCEEGECRRWLNALLAPWPQPLCKENVAWIKRTLDECSAGCCQNFTSDFLPTRLIDVGDSDRGGNIRLVETSDMKPQLPVRYAALSYCWGTKEQAASQLTTTSGTLPQRLDTILFDEMTPIMQDAVKTARALSIRYIWIDALCIVQGDLEDWAHEAERMGSVYANAFVTICAISISSCLQGFLHRPPPIRVAFRSSLQPDVQGYFNLRSQFIRSTTNNEPSTPTPARPATSIVISFSTSTFPASDEGVSVRPSRPLLEDRDLGTWSSRAWTLQEEHMSGRLLSFGPWRVHISCPMQTITEMQYGSLHTLPFFRDVLQQQQKGKLNRSLLLQEWHALVRLYIWRQSTNAKDRFPAISGPAKLMAEVTQGTYVAGLWKETLLQELLWLTYGTAINKEELLKRLSFWSPDTYIGPSWSWTYCDAIEFEGDSLSYEVDLRSECRYLEAMCTPDSLDANPYGRIKDSKLKVSGKIIEPQTTWKRIEDSRSVYEHDTWVATYDSSVILCDSDWSTSSTDQEMEAMDISFLLLASDYGIPFLLEGNPRSPYVPEYDDNGSMTEESVKACEMPSNRNAWGLLIYPIDDGARYVRVGRFRVAAPQGGLLTFANLPFQDVEIV